MKLKGLLFLSICVLFLSSCQSDDDGYVALLAEVGEELSGGDTTVFDVSQNAFGFQAANLEGENSLFFFTGNSLFNQNWVTAPATTTARDGLGPLFNAKACSSCHFKDGRGRAPVFNGELNHGLLLRLSTPGTDAIGASNPDPIYGGQLQDQSILSAETEGGFAVSYQENTITYPDGNTATLRSPTYSLTDLAHGGTDGSLKISPRVANQMIGLGLLEAIPESTLLSLADENDTNGDGISGKPNYVWDIASQSHKLGRFGWKANQPNIRQQVAGAFAGDIGITSSLFPDENCVTGVDCDQFANGGTPEITDENLDKVSLYSSALAVPARRDVDDQDILAGKALFNNAQCTACHAPKFETGSHSIAALENQTIRPYTDMLLHDMGAGLADNAPDFDANGQEWRTQPLWGIGLIETVNGHTNLLHDGRARNIEEAILWHGGEAENSKNTFMNYTNSEREQLISFLKSL